MATWMDMLDRVRGANVTNQDAAGLLLFVRAAQRRYANKYSLPPFDVIGFALPAFGWSQPGDRLVVTKAQQHAPYVASDALWGAIDELAANLDDVDQPFELVTMPQGTSKKFRELAELVQHELVSRGGRMGAAITAAEARKLVDGARPVAMTNAKKAGKAFIIVQAFADGSVQTDEFESRDAAQPMVDQATLDDQVLAMGLWDVATGKLVTQKAGKLEATGEAPKPVKAEAAAPGPVFEVERKKEKSASSSWWLFLALIYLSSKRKGRW